MAAITGSYTFNTYSPLMQRNNQEDISSIVALVYLNPIYLKKKK